MKIVLRRSSKWGEHAFRFLVNPYVQTARQGACRKYASTSTIKQAHAASDLHCKIPPDKEPDFSDLVKNNLISIFIKLSLVPTQDEVERRGKCEV